MISERLKNKIVERPTKDLLEIKTFVDNELNRREDNEINMIEFDTITNKLMNIYKATPIYKPMIKEGSI